MKEKIWHTPTGRGWTLAARLLDAPHVLIAGTTGSGKSTLLHSIMYTALLSAPPQKRFILLDPKRVELIDYQPLPHTLGRFVSVADCIRGLAWAEQIMERRYSDMERQHIKQHDGAQIYIIIDELAPLMLSAAHEAAPRLQQIAQLGRAANVHLIACTQAPGRKVIPAEITLNFTDRLALRCASSIESRQIVGQRGAELLPLHGQGILISGPCTEIMALPKTEPEAEAERIRWWINQK